MLSKLLSVFRKKPEFVYGWVHRVVDDTRRDGVRLNVKTGRVEFVLWKAGQQGHNTDYWHEMGIGWEQFFNPYLPEKKENSNG